MTLGCGPIFSIFLSFLLSECGGHLIYQSSLDLSEVSTGYQLSSFTNLRSKSKYVDIVLVGDDHKSILTESYGLNNSTFYAPKEYQYSFQFNTNLTDYSIIGTLPADFNNDKTTDLMVVFGNSDSTTFLLAILWNREDRFYSVTYISTEFSSSPSLMDYNGDTFADFISSEGSDRFFYINDPKNPGTFSKIKIVETSSYPVKAGTTKIAFGDLNGDCRADMVAISKLDNGSTIIEYWQAAGLAMNLTWQRSLPTTMNSDSYSAPVIADMDSNGKLDLVVAGCSSVHRGVCQESKIYTMYNDPCFSPKLKSCSLVTTMCEEYGFELSDTVNVFNKFTNEKETWGFLASIGTASDQFNSDYLVRPTDVDNDGHVDLLTVLKYDNSQLPVIFMNVPDNSVTGGRTFEPSWRDDLALPENLSNYSPSILASADVTGIGVDQMFVVGRDGEKFALGYYSSKDPLDTYFLKITVLCPRCLEESVTIVGASTYYKTTGATGNTEVGFGAQNSMLSIGSLQRPYTLFGLGEQANYIEEIATAYRVEDETNKFTFDSLVPNSQVYAIPLQGDEKWKLIMLVIPGKALWSTLIVLGACCLVCLVIIVGLHIKESKEDEREKRKFNAKFNFDAM